MQSPIPTSSLAVWPFVPAQWGRITFWKDFWSLLQRGTDTRVVGLWEEDQQQAMGFVSPQGRCSQCRNHCLNPLLGSVTDLCHTGVRGAQKLCTSH